MEGAMPAEAKGPRLWWRRGAKGPDGKRRDGYWIIKDDERRVSTGIRSARAGKPPQAAQDALARYILEQRQAPRERHSAAASVEVADVIAIYAADCAPKQARPQEVAGRLNALLSWWGDKKLSDVTGRTCRAYAVYRDKPVARRELEDLRAAIRHHRQEGLCREVVEVVLPERGAARERWLTRSEAARLLWAASRYRETQGPRKGQRTRRHIARFIIVALYTGTRASAICRASLGHVSAGSGYFDLEHGIFYRRGRTERATKKRQPTARMPKRLLAHARRWHANGQTYAVEWMGNPIATGIEKAFKHACADAGLRDVTPHSLRHTAATWLMQRGTSIWEAAGYLGMTPETLERTYGHHHPDHQSSAVENITRKAGRKA
jgi:integrase